MQFWLKFPALCKVMPDFSSFPSRNSCVFVCKRHQLPQLPGLMCPPLFLQRFSDDGSWGEAEGAGSGRFGVAAACVTHSLLLSVRARSAAAKREGRELCGEFVGVFE